jgi:hypothetical protein
MLTADYLDVLPGPIIELYEEYQQSVINDIARRLAKMDYASPTAAWQMQRAIESGKLYEGILEKLASITGKSESTLRDLFKNAGVKAMAFDDDIYRRAGLQPLPLNLSPAMTQVLSAGLARTQGLMRNLTQTTAVTGQDAFISAADLAYMQVSSGAFDYNSAIRQAVSKVASEGLSVINYASGRREQLDVAMRRTVLTGINQTSSQLQMARAVEMNTDLIAVSAHIGARNTGTGPANHESWQGKVYKVNGQTAKYKNFAETTGYGTGEGLGGWGCRHSFYPFFEGISENAYSREELKLFANKTVTYNGKEISVYEATQIQRGMERKVRYFKRQAGALKAAGLDASKEIDKLKLWQGNLRSFTKQTGLPRQYSREWISGLQKQTQTKKVTLPYIDKITSEYPEVANTKLSKLRKQSITELNRIEEERASSTIRDVYKYADSEELVNRERTFMSMLDKQKSSRYQFEHGIAGVWGPGDEEAFQKRLSSLKEIQSEIKLRKNWYSNMRRLEAIKQGEITGKIVLDEGDVIDLLSKVGDVYIDNGWKPSMGKPPYQPELFKESDLTGAKIRYYITLPDGRIAHPDEVLEARTRGRLIVIDKIKVAARDWTKRY